MQILIRVALVLVAILLLPRIFRADASYYWAHGLGLSFDHLPYRDFMWEYPPVAALPLLLIPLAHGSVFVFVVLFATTMALFEYGSLVTLERAWPDHALAIRRWWTALALPLCAIAWFRLDFLAVLPAAMCIAALERSRRAVGPIVLGIGAKLWPGVLVIGLIVKREWRQLRAVVALTVAGLAGWFAFSPSGFRTFLAFRRGSGVQVESTFGGLLRLTGQHPVWSSNTWVVGGTHWGWVDPAGMAVTAVVALVLALRVTRWHVRDDRLVEFLGACVVATLLGSRLFSPQFMVWLLPFVVVAAVRGGRREGLLFAVAVACTLVTMWTYAGLIAGSPLWALLVVGRNAALALMGWSLLRQSVMAAVP